MGVLLRPVDAILGSVSKVSLLRQLLWSSTPLSAREAARLAGLAHSGALRALNDLVKLGIVNRVETRGQHLHTLNFDNQLVGEGLTGLFAAETVRVAEVFGWLREKLRPHLAPHEVRSGVVFGSAARGEDGPDSDFDVLVVVDRENDVALIHQELAEAAPGFFQRFGLSLSPVVITVEQWLRQEEDGDAFALEVLRDGRNFEGYELAQLARFRGRATRG